MRLTTLLLPFAAPLVAGLNILQSTSLSTCQDNSGFSASKFDVVLTTNNNSVAVDMIATSSISGNVVFDITVLTYGYQLLRKTIDPCQAGLKGFCPMSTGKTNTPFIIQLSPSAVSQIPSIAYQFPDLDAKVIVFINSTDTGASLACVSTGISNSQTVDLIGVKWAAALVTGLALASSAMISGFGHANAASHVAANAVALTAYFQAQASIGMLGMTLPPIVQAWTQDFQWSMGIINVGFMQKIFTWYQRATGGTPSSLFSSLSQVSVQVAKRSLPLVKPAVSLYRRAVAMLADPAVEHASALAKRSNIQQADGSYLVYGIQRVAYNEAIESTNLFLTGLVFFCLALILTALAVAAFKGLCEISSTKSGWMKGDTFLEFRNGWRTVLKGILFRITLIGYPPVTILCLWEFTQNDSPAEMVLAVFFLLYTTAALGWAAFKVIQLARRSVALHKTPAYILFSDPHALNKWGFLYIQFRASAYYFVLPILAYTLIKSMFIAFGQKSPIAQAIGLILIEAAALIAASVLRPFMDKKMNTGQISILVVQFLNAICTLIFTDVFGQPPLANGIIGVFFFLLNAVTTLVFLLFLIGSTLFVFFRENPDGRYRFMSDERASFMKSSHSLSAADQLNALASTARGEKGFGSGLDLDEDEGESGSFESVKPGHADSHPPSTASSAARNSWRGGQRAGPSLPFAETRSPLANGSGNTSPTKTHDTASLHGPPSPAYRTKNNSSPWQRGAGYDHS